MGRKLTQIVATLMSTSVGSKLRAKALDSFLCEYRVSQDWLQTDSSCRKKTLGSRMCHQTRCLFEVWILAGEHPSALCLNTQSEPITPGSRPKKITIPQRPPIATSFENIGNKTTGRHFQILISLDTYNKRHCRPWSKHNLSNISTAFLIQPATFRCGKCCIQFYLHW